METATKSAFWRCFRIFWSLIFFNWCGSVAKQGWGMTPYPLANTGRNPLGPRPLLAPTMRRTIELPGRFLVLRGTRMSPKNPFLTKPFLTKQCSCGGGNPACYKCGGWGYVDAIGEGRGTENISVGLGNLSAGKNRRKICPYCNWQGRKLTRHLRLCHPNA